ncbi:MAG TPA: DUF6056 family protein [Kofleriaceae bacterium]|nr:DUF6056 family protein [Kofleriaceae bacterium]
MTAHRQTAAFAGAVAALWLLFAIQAWNTPVLLDDWYQLTWHRHHPFGLASLWEYYHFNYFHFNPRIGDLLLLIVNGPRAIHVVVTPLVELGLLWVAFAVGFARWPRPTARDLLLLLFVQVMIWLVIPIPGIIYFYRPFATNYLWGFAITLALFAPYRLALAGAPGRGRWWAVPAMFVLGWLSGMSNEHTGPAQMVAMLGFVVWAWRTRRLRAWMLAGLVGLYVGYPMLFFAPGQALRYAGIATRNTPVRMLKDRGFTGCLDIVLDFVGESQIGLDVFAGIVVLYLIAVRRRGAALVRPARATVAAVIGLVLAAGLIVATQFASPTVGERLFFAPAVLVVLACALLVEPMLEEPRLRRAVAIAFSIVFAWHAVRFVGVYWLVKRDNDARIAVLRAARPGTVAVVPPYKAWKRTRWFWGDDFQYASLREYVANEVYDLHNIQYDRIVHWSEPSPPDHYVATATFDPPLAADVVAQLAPVGYTPTFWEWAIVQLRRRIVLRGFGEHDGHRLTHVAIDSEGLGLADARHRPIHVVDWTPGAIRFVDGRTYDVRGRSYLRVWRDSVPDGVREAYVVACGQTRQVGAWPDFEGPPDLLVPVEPTCRGSYAAVLCTDDACWLSGRRFWP